MLSVSNLCRRFGDNIILDDVSFVLNRRERLGPINRLDIPGRARFEQALTEFGGTVLAVVHDRYFVRRFATRVWVLRDGGVTSFLDLDEAERFRTVTVDEGGQGKDGHG